MRPEHGSLRPESGYRGQDVGLKGKEVGFRIQNLGIRSQNLGLRGQNDNRSPKGNMQSAIPDALLCMIVNQSERKQGGGTEAYKVL